MPRQRRPRSAGALPPDDEPLEADNVRVVLIGTALWAVALVALIPFYGRLVDAGRAWLIWTCVAGFGLGMLGISYSRRHDAGRR